MVSLQNCRELHSYTLKRYTCSTLFEDAARLPFLKIMLHQMPPSLMPLSFLPSDQHCQCLSPHIDVTVPLMICGTFRTTTALTSTLSSHISLFFSLSPTNQFVEFLVRGTFFLLNLAFNAAMWALFTAALRRGDSATRVSIINVSANFMVTAILGWMIFSEKLNGIWWGGAALLAAGNVIIGRREEGEKQPNADNEFGGSARQSEDAERLLGSTGEETLLELDDEPEQRRKSNDERSRLMRAEEADAPL